MVVLRRTARTVLSDHVGGDRAYDSVCSSVSCRAHETSTPFAHPPCPSSLPSSPRPLYRRFDAWIPVCHSTCNTAYWLVLDDPSRRKTPAHRSSTLNAPDAVANFDEVCGCENVLRERTETGVVRGEGEGEGGSG